MKRKTNFLRRNSGFMAGCVLAAGVSFFAADTIMSNGLPTLTETDEETEQLTPETMAQESTEKKVYETDPFTVTASGNIIKGVETEDETEAQTESETTAQTDEEGNVIESSGTVILDENGNVIGSSEVSGGTTSSDGGSYSDGYSDGGYSDGSYSDGGSSDGSYWDGDSSDGSSSGYGDDYSYSGEPIVIYDSGNGDYYYDNSSSTGGSGTSGSSGGGSSSASGASGSVTGDFWSNSIMPDTYSRYIDESDLYIFSSSEIRLIRNEIFARHGRIFESSDLVNYFSGKSWYVPLYSAEEFDADWGRYLTEYELANLDVIVAYEAKLAGN